MQTITVQKKEQVITREPIIVDSVKFVSPIGSLNSLLCNACGNQIGSERPVAIAFGKGRGFRLCRKCSAHLTPVGADAAEMPAGDGRELPAAPLKPVR